MNRRHFFGSLAAISAGMVVDPELALWVPGRRTYFDIARPMTARNILITFSGLAPGYGHSRTIIIPKSLAVDVKPGDRISLKHVFSDGPVTVKVTTESDAERAAATRGALAVPRSVPRKAPEAPGTDRS